VSLLLPADGVLLTGDTVLGRGTAVIAADGNLGDYLRTLDQLRDLAEAMAVRLLLPGHGPALPDPVGTLEYYISHRAERLDQVRSAVAAGARTPAEIVAMVYTDVDPSLRPAAERSVRAQLDYLGEVLPAAAATWRGPPDAAATGRGGYRARRRSRSASRMTTERAEICSQPRAAKSASALFTVSREAPTS
jgi:hypothetical protein